jgi:hypothetical protein
MYIPFFHSSNMHIQNDNNLLTLHMSSYHKLILSDDCRYLILVIFTGGNMDKIGHIIG